MLRLAQKFMKETSPLAKEGKPFSFDFNLACLAFWLCIPNVKNYGTGLLFSLKGGYAMSVVLSDLDFETVKSALSNAYHEFAYLQGLRVTDAPNVEYIFDTFDLDCSDISKCVDEAISVMKQSDRNTRSFVTKKLLHASKCGFPCKRNLFYSINGYEASTSPKTQRIFDVGSALEPVVVDWLRNDGWDVDYNQGSQNAQTEVAIELRGGSIVGHHDCIISKPDGPRNVLIDIKTMNERAFTQWKREGSLKSKPQYVKQIHVYALALMKLGYKIEHLAIVGVNKNNSELHFDFFKFDQNLADEICSMSEKLFALSEPPTDDSPTEDWACKYCEFSHLCRLHIFPLIKQDSSELPTPVTEDETIINAMQEIVDARETAKQAGEIEKQAKSVIDELVRKKGLSGIQGGGYICSITEKSSPRFDSASFKKAHPDLAQQFSKQSVSVTYNVKEI